MMRTIITLAIGFYFGREIYLKHDKQKVMEKEEAIKQKLKSFLYDSGMTRAEAKETANEIVKTV